MWASVVAAHGLSSCGSRALECRLSSCGTQAYLLHGMWDPPRPGLEPMSPVLAGGFFFFFKYLFIYLFLAASSLSCGTRAPQFMGSLVAAPGLSCPVACGILVPRPGIEPLFPALEGGFLTTGPPGQSLHRLLNSPLPHHVPLCP